MTVQYVQAFGKDIEVLESFAYLDTILQNDGKYRHEFQH